VSQEILIENKKTTRRQLVWYVMWDSGGPGAGGGEEEVYFCGGKYCFTDSSSGDEFESRNLRTLLRKCGLNEVNGATAIIYSPVLSAEEIVEMLDVQIDEGSGLLINDEVWVCVSPGVLVREGDLEELPRPKDDPAQLRLPFED
jgi:hypothetical protein